jgi:PAS domain S-box-containing protein
MRVKDVSRTVERAATEQPVEGPVTVLVIDDNPGDVRLIREMLRDGRAGHRPFAIVSAERMATGLRRLDICGIDVVLLDLWLPDSRGLDTFTALHAHAPAVPVVILSERADESLALAAVQAGAQDYLAKGHVSTEILFRVLGYAVERARWLSAERSARGVLEVALERLRLATRATRDVIWDWDLATDEVDWSPAIEEIFGYAAALPESPLRTSSTWWEERIHPEERAETVGSYRRALASGWGDWVSEYRFQRADGAYAYVVDRAAIARNAEGKPVRMVGAMRDISKQREYVDALQRSDELLRTSLETLTDGVGIYAAVRGPDGSIRDFRVEYVNEAACQLWGVPRDRQLGQLLGEMVPTFRSTGRHDAYVHLVETGVSARWDGLEFDGLHFGRPCRGVFDVYAAKVGDGFVATWHDVTQRIQELHERERLLADERERREQLAFLDRTATACMESLDVGTIAQRLADALVPVLGDVAIVMLGQLGDPGGQMFVANTRPEDAPAVREILGQNSATLRRLRHSLERGEIVQLPSPADEHFAHESEDAPRFPLLAALGADSVLVVPLPASNTLLGVLIVLRGQTARTPATRNEVTLAHLVALRAALALDNARLHGELRAALASRDALAASVTHDLRNPLGVIRFGVQSAHMVLDDARLTDIQQHVAAQEALQQVDDTAGRLDGFIQELLDLANLETGASLALNREQSDLVAVVRTAVAVQALAGRSIVVDAPSAPIIGWWDRLRLDRVIGNLLSNAAKYSPSDRAIHVKLMLEPQPAGKWAILEIQDQGVGIPSPDLPRLFEPFFRGSNVQGCIAGTGLGLYGVKQIVQQHGGTLSVVSQENVGTTVTVRLPLRPPRSARRERRTAEAHIRAPARAVQEYVA